MAITFRNKHPKNPRADKKITPMRERIENWINNNQDMFNGEPKLQLHQIKRIESELTANYGDPVNITNEVLENYFKLKLYFPRTPYIKTLIDKAVKITKQLDKDRDGMIDAETLYSTITKISEFADSTIYAWFKRLNANFCTIGVYHINTVVMVVYLALVKDAKDSKKLPMV
ncbi:hypothetical protein [Nostoc phage A1]|nr:hypothetical protein [Nostoc phage A1]